MILNTGTWLYWGCILAQLFCMMLKWVKKSDDIRKMENPTICIFIDIDCQFFFSRSGKYSHIQGWSQKICIGETLIWKNFFSLLGGGVASSHGSALHTSIYTLPKFHQCYNQKLIHGCFCWEGGIMF